MFHRQVCQKAREKLRKHKSTTGSSKSAIIEHVIRSKGYEKVRVLEQEPKNFARRIFEAIHSRILKPKLIRDKEVDLDHIWDNIHMPKGCEAT